MRHDSPKAACDPPPNGTSPPILGKRVMLDLNTHDFQCQNKDCRIGATAETFGGFLIYYSRMTERLVDFVTILALETSCESSARIMQVMNIKISGDTVIRTLLKRYSAQPERKCGSYIGVDDFAFNANSGIKRPLLRS